MSRKKEDLLRAMLTKDIQAESEKLILCDSTKKFLQPQLYLGLAGIGYTI